MAAWEIGEVFILFVKFVTFQKLVIHRKLLLRIIQ